MGKVQRYELEPCTDESCKLPSLHSHVMPGSGCYIGPFADVDGMVGWVRSVPDRLADRLARTPSEERESDMDLRAARNRIRALEQCALGNHSDTVDLSDGTCSTCGATHPDLPGEEREPDFRVCNDCGFANGHHAAECLRCESGDLIDAFKAPPHPRPMEEAVREAAGFDCQKRDPCSGDEWKPQFCAPCFAKAILTHALEGDT